MSNTINSENTMSNSYTEQTEMQPQNTCIITCSSLREYVDYAQISQETRFPVLEVDRLLHVEPEKMKTAVGEVINTLSAEIKTVLVGMGFCGGVWDHVSFSRRVVIPRVDDCVSLLLHKDDKYHPNLKEEGHLYLYEKNPAEFSARSIMRDYSNADDEFANMNKDWLFHMWYDGYHHLDIIDTGYNDCYSEEYATIAQENADMINAVLDYTEGSNLLLEKLVSGRWDEQFIVAELGHLIRHADFF